MLKRREVAPGGLVDQAEAAERKESRMRRTLASLRTSNNKLFYILLLVSADCVFANIGWREADRRYAEDVRVAYVKMSPNGTTDVKFEDKEKPDEFFESTVESKLIEYTERRFSKRRETITPDYGFATLFMEPELRNSFLVDKKAAEVAADLVACKDCKSVTAKVRDIQMVDKDPMPATRTRKQYTTLVFTLMINRARSGEIESCENKIITYIWTFRPKKQVVKRNDELKYNPLGQGIIREEVRDDPTVVPLAECKKISI